MSFLSEYWWAAFLLIFICILIVLWGVLAHGVYSRYKDIDKKFDRRAAREEYLAENEQLIAELEGKKGALDALIRELDDRVMELRKNYVEAAKDNDDLNQLRGQLDELENNYRNTLIELERQIASREDELQRLEDKTEEYRLAEQKLESYRSHEEEIKKAQAELERLQHDVAELADEKTSLTAGKDVMEKLQSAFAEAFDEVFDKSHFSAQGESLAQNVSDSLNQALTSQTAGTSKAVGDFVRSCFDNQSLIKQHDELVQVNKDLQWEQEKLQAAVDEKKAELEALKNPEAAAAQDGGAFDDLYQIPDFISDYYIMRGAPGNAARDEYSVLQSFKQSLLSQGIVFSERVINAFHTTLKIQDISPLSVLAGLSGTGKTLLPTKYAEFFGMNNLVISVSPRWDSPQDLLGFYNYLGSKYQATDLSKALAAYDYVYRRDHGLEVNEELYRGSRDELMLDFMSKDQPMFLVLLDEMNLARTEYYFSEFLSKLELKRTIVNAADPDEAPAPESMVKAEITLDAQNGKRLWIPDNVLFVGTMNEDESTQTLADKVLDRANVMRFGSPDFSKISEAGSVSGSTGGYFINLETWRQWHYSLNDEDEDVVNDWLKDLNEIMRRLGRPFGIRVYQAVKSYIANYPMENRASAKSEERQAVLKTAMADQIEHKILPKLRGVDVSLKDQGIRDLAGFVERDLGDEALSRSIIAALDESHNETDIFAWSGISRQDD